MHQLLKQLDAGIEVFEAGNCADALTTADQHPQLALILLDIQLPDMNGLDALHEFRGRHPSIPIVVMSGSDNRDDVMRAIDGGAMGFLPKSQPGRALIDALRLVLAGGVCLPIEILGTPAATPAVSSLAGAGTVHTAADLGMTGRQSEVLKLMVRGKPDKIICHELGLAEDTVKVHVTAVLKILGVVNRTQAVIAVGRLGIRLGGIGSSADDGKILNQPSGDGQR